MKVRMMKRFLGIITAYFMYEVLFNGLFAWLKEEEEFNNFYVVLNQVFDFMITLALLVTFRPRVWPEYFTLSIFEDPLLGRNRQFDDHDDYNHFQIAPMKQAKL